MDRNFHREQRGTRVMQSPNTSQDDVSPSPLKPSLRKSQASPRSSDGLSNDGEDTDFKDSALGDNEQEFTTAQVTEMELANR